MNAITSPRLFFHLSAKAKGTRFWHRFSAPNLAHHLLSFARRNGIRQAILHQVYAGYLPGEKMSHNHIESGSRHHPQCIELIDSEANLRKFLHDHAHELYKVHAVLYRVELPLKI